MLQVQLIWSEFKRKTYGINDATIADKLLNTIKRKRAKWPGSQPLELLPTTAIIIPANPAKAAEISAIDNNTSRFSSMRYHLKYINAINANSGKAEQSYCCKWFESCWNYCHLFIFLSIQKPSHVDTIALSVTCKIIGKENTQSKRAFQNHVYNHSMIGNKKPR